MDAKQPEGSSVNVTHRRWQGRINALAVAIVLRQMKSTTLYKLDASKLARIWGSTRSIKYHHRTAAQPTANWDHEAAIQFHHPARCMHPARIHSLGWPAAGPPSQLHPGFQSGRWDAPTSTVPASAAASQSPPSACPSRWPQARLR